MNCDTQKVVGGEDYKHKVMVVGGWYSDRVCGIGHLTVEDK